MGHLFQDPLPRPDWTPGWSQEQITLGGHKDPGMGGYDWCCRTNERGWGQNPPPSEKTPSVTHTQ